MLVKISLIFSIVGGTRKQKLYIGGEFSTDIDGERATGRNSLFKVNNFRTYAWDLGD